MRYLAFFMFVFAAVTFAQTEKKFQIERISDEGFLLDQGWKYQVGDDPTWATPDFDDTDWETIDPTKEIRELPQVFDSRVKWLRTTFALKRTNTKALGIAINQAGASEVYLNGHLVYQFGHFNKDPKKVIAYDPLESPIYLPADSTGKYTLAVRYALQPDIRYTEIYTLTKNSLFRASLVYLTKASKAYRSFRMFYSSTDIFKIGLFIILFILHVAHYLFQRKNKAQLYLAIYLLANVLVYAAKFAGQNMPLVEYRYYALNMSLWMFFVGLTSAFLVFYKIVRQRLDIYFYLMVFYTFLQMLVTNFIYGEIPWHMLMMLINAILSSLLFIRLTRIGLKKEITGFWVLGVTVVISLFCLLTVTSSSIFWNFGFDTLGYKTMNNGMSPYFIEGVFAFGGIIIPVGLSLFMSIEGNEVTKALTRQLSENEILKNRTLEQEQEKQQILATQNETLEKQVAERTAELNHSLETLKATQEQLVQSEKLASLGELTAGIAHEIQNPLNFVNNFSELSVELVHDLSEEMQRNEIDHEYIDELFSDLAQNQEKIHHHGKRASNIVKGMLEHSRESSGEREPTNLNELADEYLRLSYHGIRARDKSFNADFKTDFDEKLPLVNVIPQDIGRVLLNLFNNAFYAVNEKRLNHIDKEYQPLVLVSSKLVEKEVVLKVRDNGTGMPKSVRDKVFQPFFTTKPTGLGTGLGLSISYDIITKGHEGTFRIDTQEGEFTEFTIKLPYLA